MDLQALTGARSTTGSRRIRHSPSAAVPIRPRMTGSTNNHRGWVKASAVLNRVDRGLTDSNTLCIDILGVSLVLQNLPATPQEEITEVKKR